MSLGRRISRRQLLRKVAVLGGGLALAGPILAACGPTPTPQVIRETVVVEKPVTKVVEKEKVVKETVVVEKKVEVPAVKEKITLRFMDRAGELGDFHRWASRQFEQKNPHITVKNEDASWDDLMRKVQVQAVAGVLQDAVYQWTAAWAPYLAKQGIWLNLESYAKADGYDLSIFYPYAVEHCTIDGHLIGLPTDAHPGTNTIFYNKDIFKAAGAKEPEPLGNWTWDEYIEQLVKIKKNTGKWGVTMILGGSNDPTWYRCWKGDLIDQQTGKKCLWNTPETQTGFRYKHDRVHKWKIMPGKAELEGDYKAMWVAGKAAVMEADASRNTGLDKAIGGAFNRGAALLPRLPTGVIGTVGSVCGFHAYAKTKYPAECWGLLKECAGFETCIWNTLNTTKQPGPVVAAWHDPRVLKVWDGFALVAKLLDEGVQRYPMPANTRLVEFFDVYGQEFTALLYGDKPYNEANVGALQKKLQDILDLPLP